MATLIYVAQNYLYHIRGDRSPLSHCCTMSLSFISVSTHRVVFWWRVHQPAHSLYTARTQTLICLLMSFSSANTQHWSNAGIMLGHCQRRWPSIIPTLFVLCLLMSSRHQWALPHRFISSAPFYRHSQSTLDVNIWFPHKTRRCTMHVRLMSGQF